MRWAILGVVLVVGCGKSTPSEAPPVVAAVAAPPVSAEMSIPEKLGAGAYQFDAALGNLDEAHKAIESILKEQGGETKEALLDVMDTFDSVGKTLAEYNVAPTKEELDNDSAAAGKWRKMAIDDANASLSEIREARGILSDLLASEPPAKEKTALGNADDAMAEAEDAVKEGITLLGGTPDPEPKEVPAPQNGDAGGG